MTVIKGLEFYVVKNEISPMFNEYKNKIMDNMNIDEFRLKINELALNNLLNI